MDSGMKKLLLLLCLGMAVEMVQPAQAGLGLGAKPAAPSAVPIRWVDSAEMFSTPNLSDDDALQTTIRSTLGEAWLTAILAYSSEETWPLGMSTLDGRNENRDEIARYVAYRILRVSGDRSIVWVPAAENQHLSADFAPAHDFFVLINNVGVSDSGAALPLGAAPVPGVTIPTAAPVAQTVAPAPNPASSTKGTPIRWVDSAQMMSTPNLPDDPDALAAIRAVVGEAGLQEVIDYSHERNWPGSMSTLQGRNDNRSAISSYVAYAAVDLKDGRYILWIPAAENQHMPANLRPTKNFFMMIGESGIQLPSGNPWVRPTLQGAAAAVATVVNSAPVTTSTTATAPIKTGDFASSLNQIIEALRGNFSSITGAEIVDDSPLAGLSTEYQSTIALPGAEKSYLSEGIGSARRFIAPYGDFRDQASAEKKLKEVVALIDAAALPCCTLVKNENRLDNLYSVYYLPFDMSGKMGPGLAGMVLEVEMIKSLGIDTSGGTIQTFDQWMVTLRVYKQD
jgi:hypothetical protein